MKEKLTFLIFILFCCFNQTALGSYAIPIELIKHADATPRDIEGRHEKLSDYLASGCKNDIEKVAIFTYWIARNINYVVSEARQHQRTDKTAFEVLSNKQAVCEGYCNLFEQFCKNENIVCYTIFGKAYGNVFRRVFSYGHMWHTWNAVYVNNQWQLLDVTWARTEFKESYFKDSSILKWMFCEPKEFAESHYPNDPRWQMMKSYRSKKEFWHEKRKITDKNYAWKDSLQILLERPRYINELIIFKSAQQENPDNVDYMLNIILLGWKYVGGNYEEEKINQGIAIFNYCQKELNQTDTGKHQEKFQRSIDKGLKLGETRLEKKE